MGKQKKQKTVEIPDPGEVPEITPHNEPEEAPFPPENPDILPEEYPYENPPNEVPPPVEEL